MSIDEKQETDIFKYYKKYWQQTISTERADRERAERAAGRMAEIAGVKVNEIIWVESAEEGRVAYDKAWALNKDSFDDSTWPPLQALLKNTTLAPRPFSYEKWALIRTLYRDKLEYLFKDPIWNSVRNLINNLPGHWVSYKVSSGVVGLLWEFFDEAVYNSIRESFRLTYDTYAVDVLGVNVSEKALELLELRKEITASCFAVWLVPGHIILCDRPKHVEIKDNWLKKITWYYKPLEEK